MARPSSPRPASSGGKPGARPAAGARKGSQAGSRPGAATYRRRRVTLLVIALLVLGGIAFGAVKLFGAPGSEPSTGPVADATATATPGASASTSPTTSPATSPTPTQGATLDVPTACTPEQAELDVVVPASSAAGSAVGIAVEVRATGTVPCLTNLGADSLTIEVYSGEDRIWSSLDCAFDPAARALLLGEGAEDRQQITWPGNRSVAECASGQPGALAGTYRVIATQVLDGQTLSAESTLVLQ